MSTDNGKHRRPRVYVSSPCGFTAAGDKWYYEVLLPMLIRRGFVPLDPWEYDGKHTEVILAETESEANVETAEMASIQLSERIGSRNASYVREAEAVLAVLDGTDVDSGVAAEVGYAAGVGKPVVGLRTDRRSSADNAGTPINLQVMYFISLCGGEYVVTVGDACDRLDDLLQ